MSTYLCAMTDLPTYAELVDYGEDSAERSVAGALTSSSAVVANSDGASGLEEGEIAPSSQTDADGRPGSSGVVDKAKTIPDGASGAVVNKSVGMAPPLLRSQSRQKPSSSSASAGSASPLASPPPPPEPMADIEPPSRDVALFVPPNGEETFPSFPAPREFDDVDCYAGDDITLRTIGRAPWFHRGVVLTEDNQLERYEDEYGFLPGKIHAGSVEAWTWRFQFAVCDNDIAQSDGVLPSTARSNFVAAAHEGLARLSSIHPVPDGCESDMFLLRYDGDADYVRALNAIPAATIASWKNFVGVRQEALCYQGPLLRRDFRYCSKDSDFWLDWRAAECYFRSRFGQVVAYQCPQMRYMNHDARRRAFFRVTNG